MTESKKWTILGGIILAGFLIYILAPILSPFLTAAILAYLVDPVVLQLQRLKIPRTLAVSIVFLFLLITIFLFFFFLIPILQAEVEVLITKIPMMINWMQTALLPWINDHFKVKLVYNAETVKSTIAANWGNASNILGSFMATITASGLAILAWLTNLVLIPVVLFYLLRDWSGFLTGVQKLLPRRVEPTATKLFLECDEVLSAFLRGQLMVMLGLGILYSFGLWLAGIEFALLIGSLAGLVSIVPYLGLIVGIISAAITAYFQFGDFIHIVYVLIVFIAAQGIEGMVLTPIFVGDKIGLHPAVVIFAILAGGELFGFVGILLALPIAAIIMVFVRFIRNQYISSQLYQQEQEPSVIEEV